MYRTNEFHTKKTRQEFLTILERFYPKDKDRLKTYKYTKLRAIYINLMNKRMKLV